MCIRQEHQRTDKFIEVPFEAQRRWLLFIKVASLAFYTQVLQVLSYIYVTTCVLSHFSPALWSSVE